MISSLIVRGRNIIGHLPSVVFSDTIELSLVKEVRVMKSSVGPSWEEVKKELFTEEEIREIDVRVSEATKELEKEDSK